MDYKIRRSQDDINAEIELLERMQGYKRQEIMNVREFLDTADAGDEKARVLGVITRLEEDLAEYDKKIAELKSI